LIPLDLDTDEPHNCPVWIRQQEQLQKQTRRYRECRKGCGELIYFADNEYGRTESGKWVPLDKETGEAHQCPQ
jgi:hypothetical protein